MKKIFALALCIIMLLSMVACGSQEQANTSDDTISHTDSNESNTLESESTESNDSADSLESDIVDSETIESDSPELDTTKDETVDSQNQITFEELMVVDNNECTVKITGIDQDKWGYSLNVYLENKSSDKNYMFSVKNAAINGVECDPFFASEVASGKKANKEIDFSDSTLEKNQITDITDIELTFRVYDSDDWSADSVAEETVHVYPYGEENAVSFVREPQSSDNIIIDNEYVTAIVTGYENDDIWGYTANLFLVNKSDKEIMFTVDDASVNGFMVDPFYSTSVMPGKCKFSSMSWSDTTLEENGITDIEEIEFIFRAYDSDDWSADDFVNELITLQP